MTIINRVWLPRITDQIAPGDAWRRPQEDNPEYPPRRAFIGAIEKAVWMGFDWRTGEPLSATDIKDIEDAERFSIISRESLAKERP